MAVWAARGGYGGVGGDERQYHRETTRGERKAETPIEILQMN